MLIKRMGSIAISAVAVLLVASCASTTGSFEGSTDTFGNTTEASSKFTSSTSPSGDDEAKAEQVLQFARVNYHRLRSDMAVGHGEYLASLAVLMEIDESKRDDFYAMTKDQFDQLYISSQTSPDEMIANLQIQAVQL